MTADIKTVSILTIFGVDARGRMESAARLFAPNRAADGVTVAVRVKPRSKAKRGRSVQDSVRGTVILANGVALEVSVAAPPAKGRANDATLAALAKAWQLPKSALTIVSGNRSRLKIILIDGEPKELLPRLEAWLLQLSARGGAI